MLHGHGSRWAGPGCPQQRWAELGLEGIGNDDPDPSLFGYALDRLIQGLKTGQ